MTSTNKNPVAKLLHITAELAEAVRDFRHQQRIKSEAEAFRVLLSAGLAAFQQSSKKD